VRRASFAGTKFGGGGKRGRAKIHSPQPPSFLPARAFGFGSAVPPTAGAIIRSFVQKRFELRSVIATMKQNEVRFMAVKSAKLNFTRPHVSFI